MYSFVEKEEAIKKIRELKNTRKVHLETGIPLKIINEWKEEMKLRGEIYQLINRGKLEEAKIKIEELNF